ncbi:MAG: hypothetical protein KGJ13_04615 [Patescibacteria group bacterium]|nr:hypothetical protein [Patescibacteria group bacterium]
MFAFLWNQLKFNVLGSIIRDELSNSLYPDFHATKERIGLSRLSIAVVARGGIAARLELEWSESPRMRLFTWAGAEGRKGTDQTSQAFSIEKLGKMLERIILAAKRPA